MKDQLPTIAKCQKSVYYPGSYHSHPCTRKAWKDGWCKQHHPDTVAERVKKRDERWKKEKENSPFRSLDEKLSETRRCLREAMTYVESNDGTRGENFGSQVNALEYLKWVRAAEGD